MQYHTGCDAHKNFCTFHHMTDDGVKLVWNNYEGDNLKYYKVVWSQKNADPKYPEDGHIKAISNSEKSRLNSSNFDFIVLIFSGISSGLV